MVCTAAGLRRVALDAPHSPLVEHTWADEGDATGPCLARGLTWEGYVVTGGDATSLEVRDWETLEVRAQLHFRHTYHHWVQLAVDHQGRRIAAADSGGALFFIDIESRKRVWHTMQDVRCAALTWSPQGDYVAALMTGARRGYLRVWRGPQVHIAECDRRAIDAPTRGLRDAVGALTFDDAGEILYAVTSSPTHSTAARQPGWRATVEAHDVVDGRRWWHAEIDAEITGDMRTLAQIGWEGGVSLGLALSEDQRTLYVGGTSGALIALDARDGALRRLYGGAGSSLTHQLHWGCEGRLWGLTDRGHLLRYPEDAYTRRSGKVPQLGEQLDGDLQKLRAIEQE